MGDKLVFARMELHSSSRTVQISAACGMSFDAVKFGMLSSGSVNVSSDVSTASFCPGPARLLTYLAGYWSILAVVPMVFWSDHLVLLHCGSVWFVESM